MKSSIPVRSQTAPLVISATCIYTGQALARTLTHAHLHTNVNRGVDRTKTKHANTIAQPNHIHRNQAVMFAQHGSPQNSRDVGNRQYAHLVRYLARACRLVRTWRIFVHSLVRHPKTRNCRMLQRRNLFGWRHKRRPVITL